MEMQRWIEVANKAWEAKRQRKYFETLEVDLFKELKDLSGNEKTSAGGFIFNPIERKGSIDYPSIPLLQHIDLEQFRKSGSVYWKLEKE